MNLSFVANSALIVSFFLSLIFPINNVIKSKSFIRAHVALICFFVVFAFFLLILAYVTNDFSILSVSQNSQVLQPLIYKISASWASYEGSLLFLVMLFCIYNVGFAWRSKYVFARKVLALQCFICFLFLFFIIFVANPFVHIMYADNQGWGLNPLLQDVALTFHPPILYAAYAGLSLLFSITVVALFHKSINKDWASSVIQEITVPWSCLVVGIGAGSWWAYRELDWGGFWFWDPVESIALIPCLLLTVSLHLVRVVNNKNRLNNLAAIFVAMPFMFFVLGLFLVRGDMLESVHSFASDNKIARYLLMIFIVLFCIFLMAFIFGCKRNIVLNKLPRAYYMIFCGSLIGLYAVVVIVAGIICPIVSKYFFNVEIFVDSAYFGKLLVPVVPILSCLMICIRKFRDIYLLLFFLSCVIFFYYFKWSFCVLFVVFCAFIFNAMFYLYGLINNRMALGHCGFIILIFGVLCSSFYHKEKIINMKEGDSVLFAGHKIELLKFIDEKFKNYYSKKGIFVINNKHVNLATLQPEIRFYPLEKVITAEADIYSYFLLYDLHVNISKFNNNFIKVRLNFRPLTSLIWIGCVLMGLSLFIKKRKLNKKLICA